MASILFLIEAIQRNQFRCNSLENKKLFLIFFCIFEIQFECWKFSKKKMTLIAEVFPELRTLKKKITSMLKKSRLKESFGKQHGKRAQTLLEFAWQHLYHICWSLWRQLTYKKSLLVRCKIWRLFPNTLRTDDRYSLFKRDNLTQPI